MVKSKGKTAFCLAFLILILLGTFSGCKTNNLLSVQQITGIQIKNISELNLTYQTPYPSVNVNNPEKIKNILTPIMNLQIQKSIKQPDQWTAGGWQLRIIIKNQDGSIITLDISKESILITHLGDCIKYDILTSFDTDSFIENIVETYRLAWITPLALVQLSPSEISSISISQNENMRKIENSDQILKILDFLYLITMEDIYTEELIDIENSISNEYCFLITYSNHTICYIKIDLKSNQVKISGQLINDEIKNKWRVYPLVNFSQQEKLKNIFNELG